MRKRMALWGVVLLAGAGFYFALEQNWKKALGLVVGSLLIDLAVDEGLLDWEKRRGKID